MESVYMPKARNLLSQSGVIGIDGDTLSSFLADRSAGMTSSTFDRKDFVSWVTT